MANPNPSPSTRFGAKNGNPSGAGKTKAQRQAEIEAAEKAAILRNMMLSEMLESVTGADDGKEEARKALEFLTNEALRLFKDSEDRAHGQPDQTVTNKHQGEGAEKLGAFLHALTERSGNTGKPSEG